MHILTGCRADWLKQKVRNEGETRGEAKGVKRPDSFFHIVYHKILSIVPCAVQQVLVGYLFYT